MAILIKKALSTPVSWNPILAAEGVLGNISYPKVVMPKLNGVRGINQNGVIMPRSLKVLRNHHTRKLFSLPELANLDGELVVGDFSDEEVFVISTSGVGSADGTPEVLWHVFDYYHPTATYLERLKLRNDAVDAANHPAICLVPWVVVNSDEELVKYADWALAQGYEGLVIRCPNAKYKTGRSTDKEQYFMRYCPWLKGEAEILSVQEGEINNNESVVNELGFKKKSSHKANKVGSGQAGAFTVRDLKTGIEFNMPVPSDKLQKEVWDDPSKFIGKLAHYNYKPAVKIGGKPRFPQLDQEHSFIGLREPWDMS